METTLTPRQTFRQTVADVAARAKERLPAEVNGRVESAVKLVLAHDVTPQADGSIEVGSSSDPLKTYRLVGASCTCQDFAHGKAPGGWCQHRIAAGIAKRVQQLLPVVPEMVEPWPDNDPEDAPQSTPVETDALPQPLPEAPASCNVYVMIGGHKVQVTLRDTDEHRMLERLAAVLAPYPVPTPVSPQAPTQGQLSPQQPNAAAMHRPVTGFCIVHNVEMRWNEGKGGRKGWYSHRTDDGWCKGR